jgi:hypothetical protein
LTKDSKKVAIYDNDNANFNLNAEIKENKRNNKKKSKKVIKILTGIEYKNNSLSIYPFRAKN